MEDLIKNIKSKLSVDNLVQMMKEAKVIDNNTIKEEDVRKTLEKIDTNNLVDVDELAQKLNEITEQSKQAAAAAAAAAASEKKSSISSFNIFSKSTPPKKVNDEKDAHFIKDDVSFLD